MTAQTVFVGRLGLAGARVPHIDRHGLLWLTRGNLYVQDGVLRFAAAESDHMAAGDYAIPYQTISLILLGPGTSLTHDVLRLAAMHGTGIVAVGEGGVKFYSAPPIGQGRSEMARMHAALWADQNNRVRTARRMYALRFGEVVPHTDLSVLRGIEGSKIRHAYTHIAQAYGIPWRGRRYDRAMPEAADIPNQAINHAATFVEAAAEIAVAAVGALPPLGFIHEDSSNAFTLDIADLVRTQLTIPIAFSVAARVIKNPTQSLEREVRHEAVRVFREKKVVGMLIDRVKELLSDDSRCDS